MKPPHTAMKPSAIEPVRSATHATAAVMTTSSVKASVGPNRKYSPMMGMTTQSRTTSAASIANTACLTGC